MENLEKFIEKRVRENKELFSMDELNSINDISIKLYILGLIDGKKIYN